MPGQESVWDYPRPPRLESVSSHIAVDFSGIRIAESTETFRVLETSHPPVYYLPPKSIRMDLLRREQRTTFCEWKGSAKYWSIVSGDRIVPFAAWSYESPSSDFQPIRGYLAFYPGKVDACYLNGELVTAQPGDFYGGWITSAVTGPFKGDPGTRGW